MKNYYRLILVILFYFLSVCFSFGQLRLDTLGWIPPVDIPIYLSGNFAELRTGHFHAGIDIKTQGKEGFKLYAVQNGYISRIKVSPTGYGKAIYINHPDGYTSVYAHLKEFNIQIDKYVKAAQYEKESFPVNLFPGPNELKVNQGDVIGLSGNSGGSAGPHLHFEIRDSKTAKPMNGLFLGYDIEDNIAPKMFYLYAYPKSTLSHVNGKTESHYYSLKKLNGHYQLRQGDTLEAFGNVGFGLKVNDYLDGSWNKCGVHKLKVFVNNQLYFYNKFDSFSFAETSYINSLMDYKENTSIKRKVHKLFIDPNNRLSVYVNSRNNGIINFSDNELYNVRIEAVDVAGHVSSLEFFVKGMKKDIDAPNNYDFMIPWQNDFLLDTLGISLSIPQNAFYDTLFMKFEVDTIRAENTFSNTYHIHDELFPMHKRLSMQIAYDSIVDSLKYKLLIAKVKDDKLYSAGGDFEGNTLKLQTKKMGSYVVTIDTTPPIIEAYGAWALKEDISDVNTIEFKLTDNLSGIKIYRGFINGNWVLFEWDPKNDHLFYNFDEKMPKEGDVEIRLEVWDDRGNFSLFETTCIKNAL